MDTDNLNDPVVDSDVELFSDWLTSTSDSLSDDNLTCSETFLSSLQEWAINNNITHTALSNFLLIFKKH